MTAAGILQSVLTIVINQLARTLPFHMQTRAVLGILTQVLLKPLTKGSGHFHISAAEEVYPNMVTRGDPQSFKQERFLWQH